MGNISASKLNRKNCFDEIRFILVSHQAKYREYAFVPKYGLRNTINNLEKNQKINFQFVREFMRDIKRWKTDTEFSLTVKTYTNKVENTVVYLMFLRDLVHLENKVIEILDKYRLTDSVDLHSI